MIVAAHEVIEAARTHANMSVDELWLAYFALGGTALPDDVRSYLDGSGAESIDYDVLAQAINEKFIDQGGNHPVPYREDMAESS